MKQHAWYPSNYSSRPYGQRSHFLRNVIIVLIILFFLPGLPEFISDGFNFATLFTVCLAFWKQMLVRASEWV